MEPDLAASVIIRNKNNVWIDDNMVTACHCCRKTFGYFVRKHHCRNCGNIFCYECINQSIEIPDFIEDRPDPADYWNLSFYITSLKNTEQKVCRQCYVYITNKINARNKIIEIIQNPLPIDKIKELSESSADIKNHYFDHLRNIQYYLPNHKYTEIDKKFLQINAVHFSHHSKYLVHLIKSINWGIEKDKTQQIIDILHSEKNKTCQELYCTRTCQENLSCDDCINILYSCIDQLPNELLHYIFNIIMQTSEQVILCHLSFFVGLIQKNSTNDLLKKFLFDLLSDTMKLAYNTFWFLNNIRQTSEIIELQNINTFVDLFNPELVKIMYQEYTFYVGLISHLEDPKRYLLNNFEKAKPITVPYNPEIKLVDVDYDNITIMNSYTKPVIIPFKTSKGKQIRLLFKRESIMNDVIVLNLMTLCDIILHESLDIDFGVIVYPIMPLTNRSGMIEIIDHAETIHNIGSKKKNILQYIIEKNENKVISEVMNRYMYSLVSYTLHSYFLGLGDRHLQNVMITEDGAIFHIDFGFILGNDAYPLTATNIKLNSSMLDVIGGSDGTRYSIYLDLCSKGVLVMRKFFNMFFILLCQNTHFKEKYIEKFILSRFQPRQVDSVVISELISIIKHSNNAYSGIIQDFLHYHTQEKTIQHGIGKMVKSALHVIKGSHKSK